ncbi:RNA-binding S4 domain-containing protein [bacterium]|nr:RNA-binding S4 domain-containing protein [bacterium]
MDTDEIRILELLVNAGLAESNGEAKKLLQQNAISVNEEKVTDL